MDHFTTEKKKKKKDPPKKPPRKEKIKQKKRKRGDNYDVDDDFIDNEGADSDDDYNEEKKYVPSKEELEFDAAEEALDTIQASKNRTYASVVNPCPDSVFTKKLDKFAEKYTDFVLESEQPFTWDDLKPKQGDGFSTSQRQKIRKQARKLNPTIFPVADKNGFVQFPKQFIKYETKLPKKMYEDSDLDQFQHLDDELSLNDPNYQAKDKSGNTVRKFKKSEKRHTWHHHQDKGKMQLVEMGIHDATYHKGGREVWGNGAAGRKGNKRRKLTTTT